MSNRLLVAGIATLLVGVVFSGLSYFVSSTKNDAISITEDVCDLSSITMHGWPLSYYQKTQPETTSFMINCFKVTPDSSSFSFRSFLADVAIFFAVSFGAVSVVGYVRSRK
jgi:hypothetical protein